MMRLQKERDAISQEVTTVKEKLELVQSQVAKATRDRELLLSETETSRERFDKVNQNLIKVQVGTWTKSLFDLIPHSMFRLLRIKDTSRSPTLFIIPFLHF